MSSRRIKSRPALSCTRCRERKVKCDRVKPCQACCIHGQPRECVYEEDGDDRLAIAQAHEIQRLRAEVTNLRKKLASKHADSDASQPDYFYVRPGKRRHWTSSPSSEGETIDAPVGSNQVVKVTHVLAPAQEPAVNFAGNVRITQPSTTLNLLWANFMDQFIDKICPPSITGDTDWLRSLALESSHSELLSNAFCVASFFHCGLIHSNRTLEIEGRRMYGKVLRDLQVELYDRERSTQPHVLYTLLLLSIHEILYFQHPTAWLAHISGAEKLLEMCIPIAFAKGLERETFLHFRVFDLSLNIFRRRRTFLALPQWKTKQWQTKGAPENMIQTLMDDMVDLPGIFEDADVLATKLSSETPSPEESESLKREFCDKLDDFEERLRQWTERWIDPWPGYHCRPAQIGDPQCVSDQELFSRSLWYADDRVARGICLYSAGRLLLSRVDIRPHRPTETTIEQLSFLICDSMNFLLAVTNDYVSALNMLFPLRVAYFSLSESSCGRAWIQDVLWHISLRFDMSFALQFTTALPGKGGQIKVA